MNLIERYVNEVGKHLPRKQRLDIEAELRSTLEDMLEDRSQQAGHPADDAMIEELLKEYGAPRDVAATYQAHPYLIGPRIFNTYTLVLKIVLFAVTLGLTIAMIVSVLTSHMTNPEILKTIGEFAANLVSSLVAAFGNVTLIFAILERVLPEKELQEKEEWNPAELTKEPDPGTVKVADRIASIAFTLIGLMLLNFYPQVLSLWTLENGEFTQLVTVSNNFFRFLPWINLSGILTIALDIWLLRQRAWNATTRWIHIGLQLFGIGIVMALLNTPDLLTTLPGVADTETSHILMNVFGRMLPIAFIIVIIVDTIEIVKDAIQLLRPKKVSYPIGKASE